MNVPLYEQLYNHVLSHIRAGTLRHGDRVPSETELAQQFNVSRITSKKALSMLEQNGMIERIRGKGSFVRLETAFAPLPRPDQSTSTSGQLIGVIVPDFSDAYALGMIHAIEETCAAQNLFIAVKRTYGSQDVEKQAIQGLIALGVRGLIVFPVHGEFYNPELLRLVVTRFPIVLVDRHLKGIPASAVYIDNVNASRQLTLHLIAQGCRQIAFVSPPAENTSTIEERIAGYKIALNERGIAYSADYVLTTLYSTLPKAFETTHVQRDIATLRDYIQRHPAIDAFVASEYNVALLIAGVIQSLGLSHKIVCFDSPESPLFPPLFTHIKQNERLMGQRAVEVLGQHLAGQTETQTHVIDFDFVEAAATIQNLYTK